MTALALDDFVDSTTVEEIPKFDVWVRHRANDLARVHLFLRNRANSAPDALGALAVAVDGYDEYFGKGFPSLRDIAHVPT